MKGGGQNLELRVSEKFIFLCSMTCDLSLKDIMRVKKSLEGEWGGDV